MAQDSKEQLEATLQGQHEQIRTLLDSVQSVGAQQRAVAFVTLSRFLAAHEAAEETAMHPRFDDADGDSDVVRQRVQEEQDAGELIARLEELDPTSDEFMEAFAGFADAVRSHAEAEERDELTPFLESITDEDAAAILQTLKQVLSVVADTQDGAPAGSGRFAEMLQSGKDQFRVGAGR